MGATVWESSDGSKQDWEKRYLLYSKLDLSKDLRKCNLSQRKTWEHMVFNIVSRQKKQASNALTAAQTATSTYSDSTCFSSYLHHGPGAGGKLSGTLRQKSGSIGWGSHQFFCPDEQRYGSGSSQIQDLLPQEPQAPSLSFPHQKSIPHGRSHILPYVSTWEKDREASEAKNDKENIEYLYPPKIKY